MELTATPPLSTSGRAWPAFFGETRRAKVLPPFVRVIDLGDDLDGGLVRIEYDTRLQVTEVTRDLARREGHVLFKGRVEAYQLNVEPLLFEETLLRGHEKRERLNHGKGAKTDNGRRRGAFRRALLAIAGGQDEKGEHDNHQEQPNE